MNQQLILICGLPGSGKTTLAGSLLTGYNKADNNRQWRWYENDMYFEQTGPYKYDPDKMDEAWTWCQDSTRRSLDAGYSVIVSNTFTTYMELSPYYIMTQDRPITPQVIVCYGDFGSIHNVPNQVVSRMRERAWWRKP